MRRIGEFQGQYRFLSNFWPCKVVYMAIEFGSVEAAYQASKCAITSDIVRFAKLSPGDSKRLGRIITLRDDWERVKLSMMMDFVQQKFTRDEFLRSMLLSTDDAELIEGNYWNDTYWGVCRGKGENHLGKILMMVRESLR